jgi:hypothetical protein
MQHVIYECHSFPSSFCRLWYTGLKKITMSAPLTPFQGAQLRTATVLNGLYNSSDSSHMSSSLDDISPSSGSFGSAPTTPLYGSLLSPPNIPSSIHDSLLSASMGLVDKENSAYNQLMRRYNQLEEDLRNEKQNHNLLK